MLEQARAVIQSWRFFYKREQVLDYFPDCRAWGNSEALHDVLPVYFQVSETVRRRFLVDLDDSCLEVSLLHCDG